MILFHRPCNIVVEAARDFSWPARKHDGDHDEGEMGIEPCIPTNGMDCVEP